MRKKILAISMVLAIFATQQVRAQFAVIDPVNIATSISNTATQIVQTSSTAANMLNNFREVQRVYNQGREHFDRLRSVHNLVQDARKVRDAILMVGEISDMFVNNFQLMLTDPNFRFEELVAISNGYTILLNESANMLLELRDVVNVTGLMMSDAERMNIISDVYVRLRNHRNLVSYFTRKTISVSYLRSQRAGNTDRILALYGSARDRVW